MTCDGELKHQNTKTYQPKAKLSKIPKRINPKQSYKKEFEIYHWDEKTINKNHQQKEKYWRKRKSNHLFLLWAKHGMNERGV